MAIVIDDKRVRPFFKEGEIWWCGIGLNIGREIFGKGTHFIRPVIVLKKLNKDSFLAIPLTTKLKSGSWYVPISYGGAERRAILSQIRVFDAKRLSEKMGTLSMDNFKIVKDAFLMFYGS
jgi:mRNA interferase MazF